LGWEWSRKISTDLLPGVNLRGKICAATTNCFSLLTMPHSTEEKQPNHYGPFFFRHFRSDKLRLKPQPFPACSTEPHDEPHD
jgi:hypothetical protein